MNKKHIEKYRLIAKAIKEHRIKNNLTQEQFAEMIGVSKSYVSKIEAPNSQKKFSLEILFDISSVLDVPIKCFFKYL